MVYTCPHCKNSIYDNDALLCLYCGKSLKRGIGFMGKIKYPCPRIIIIIISIFVLVCFILLSAGCNTASAKNDLKHTKGEIYPDMPKRAIKKAGYTKKLRKEYYRTGNKEWIVYDNYATEKEGDLVVFYLVGGKLKSWFGKEEIEEEEEKEEKNKE